MLVIARGYIYTQRLAGTLIIRIVVQVLPVQCGRKQQDGTQLTVAVCW